MIFAAVTVTYGDRYNYLKQVIDSLIEQEIDKIFIVSNGSEEKSLNKIKQISANEPRIELLELNKNTGSANGFSTGIEFAYKENADFIWLLDDDNYPKENALKQLKFWWGKLYLKEDLSKPFCLLSYRDDRFIYKEAIKTKDPYRMLGGTNSFLGFDLLKLGYKKDEYDENINFGPVAVAPYGGMFFSKTLIDQIGLPNKIFYLYGDDYDYSYRITKNKGKIILLLDSQITDLEQSFHIKKKKNFLNTRFFNTDSHEKLYYNVRNSIVFEQNFVKNKMIYAINRLFYFIILFLLMLLRPRHFGKYKILIKAYKESINIEKTINESK